LNSGRAACGIASPLASADTFFTSAMRDENNHIIPVWPGISAERWPHDYSVNRYFCGFVVACRPWELEIIDAQ